ncbi:MAG: hypothetical protein BWK72_10055 [Rhodoferax ferrireducens]|uniref:Uncharacterized protein n=2 Tax=Pseudomonadota TaxID=1224 RepID=A0A1Y1QYM1_9GAMM|nr:MAG: hypothetical protein BWK72_10055 [Rhodoferax ferrireducens]OQX16816.1 MAG: hypothetical protein BWK73_02430 [Thiothrix lacustris]
MHYFDIEKNQALGFPPLVDKVETVSDTWPMPLHDLPENHQIEQALNIIGEKHPHIARAITTFWGFQEGADYLDKLIFDGSDPKSHTREGFKSDVLAALLTLQTFHSVTSDKHNP